MAVNYADVAGKQTTEDGWSLTTTHRKEKRLDGAHRRFMHSIKVLTDVRRLLGQSRQLKIFCG